MKITKRGLCLVFFISFLFLVLFSSFSKGQPVDVTSSITILPSEDWRVIYDEFKPSLDTTNFDYCEGTLDEELCLSQIGPGYDLTYMTLDNGTYNKVDWYLGPGEYINLTEVHESKIIDLDSYIDSSLNELFVNTTHFWNLVGHVNITFFNHGLTTPEILFGGVPCTTDTDPSCTVLFEDGDTLIFNTTFYNGDLTYSLRDAYVAPPGGGGGGGGGGTPKDVNYTVEPIVIDLTMEPGDSKITTFFVNNTGDTELSLTLKSTVFSKIVTFNPEFLQLKFHQKKAPFHAVFKIGDDEPGQLYTGKLDVVHNLTYKKSVNVILRVLRRDALFDLFSDLKDDLLWKGQRLKPTINMDNVGNLKVVDVNLEYLVMDFENNQWEVGEEWFTLEGSSTIDRSLPIPRGLKKGEYVFITRLNYQDEVATTANPFVYLGFNWLLFILILGGLVIVSGGYLYYYHGDELRKFRWIVAAGGTALKTFKLRKAIERYKKLRSEYYYLYREERPPASKEGAEYFRRVQKAVEERKRGGFKKPSKDVKKKK